MMSEFEDRDLLDTIQDRTGYDMTDMFVVKKEIVNNKLRVYYRPKWSVVKNGSKAD